MRRIGLSLLLMTLCGCASDPREGYSFAPAHDQGIQSVSVIMFDNETFDTGIEQLLTEAVIKEIQRTTPWTVVPSTGDTVLRGVIRDASYQRLSRTPGTGLTQEALRRLTVDFTWRDNRTGHDLAVRRDFSVAAGFVSQRGVGEPLEVGQYGVIEELARAIVGEMRSTW